jgi:hypothetical protein
MKNHALKLTTSPPRLKGGDLQGQNVAISWVKNRLSAHIFSPRLHWVYLAMSANESISQQSLVGKRVPLLIPGCLPFRDAAHKLEHAAREFVPTKFYELPAQAKEKVGGANVIWLLLGIGVG